MSFWGRVSVGSESECWPWKGATVRGGYGQLKVAGKHQYAHRRAYEMTHGAFDQSLRVLHRCDNPPCCNPSHLVLGTQAENVADRDAKRRQANGERNGQSRLSQEQVLSIRSDTDPDKAVAVKYGVTSQYIGQIRSRKWWAHV